MMRLRACTWDEMDEIDAHGRLVFQIEFDMRLPHSSCSVGGGLSTYLWAPCWLFGDGVKRERGYEGNLTTGLKTSAYNRAKQSPYSLSPASEASWKFELVHLHHHLNAPI